MASSHSHPLPAPVRSNPAAQPRSLAEHLSAPTLCPLPDFKKKSTEEVVGILEKKVSATIEHYQAIFDKKYLFESLLGDSQHTLHHFADQLNWVSDNFDKADNWSKQQHNSISWACRCVRTIEFSTKEEPLVKRFRKVTKDLTSIANRGYLDWINLKADSILVLKKSSDYKVWSSQMLGYLTFVEADEALLAGDLKDTDYKKANT
ncbi:hypothetical protein FOMPIDRAFT_1050173 [Fomitopsis schrenkii]|uniref:Uncharacterized protein n=1 Tax=Fomitopsis schrenkii TaxID=2126942 RepID=S8E526_FOMSC|nr:hypothetical protein FOMPIDRAFT_1050173 [Fomitopsis schrenkii]